MKSASNALRLTLKLTVSLVLVAWILHVIFSGEAELQLGESWGAFSFAEQVRKSWTIGPIGLSARLARLKFDFIVARLTSPSDCPIDFAQLRPIGCTVASLGP